jgi:hypothetical protein
MEKDKKTVHRTQELGYEDQDRIRMIFHEEVVPKLVKYHARIGTLNCQFAGDQYKNWNIRFRSAGTGFEIVEFEYDEEGTGRSLDLK